MNINNNFTKDCTRTLLVLPPRNNSEGVDNIANRTRSNSVDINDIVRPKSPRMINIPLGHNNNNQKLSINSATINSADDSPTKSHELLDMPNISKTLLSNYIYQPIPQTPKEAICVNANIGPPPRTSFSHV